MRNLKIWNLCVLQVNGFELLHITVNTNVHKNTIVIIYSDRKSCFLFLKYLCIISTRVTRHLTALPKQNQSQIKFVSRRYLYPTSWSSTSCAAYPDMAVFKLLGILYFTTIFNETMHTYSRYFEFFICASTKHIAQIILKL